MNGLPVWAQLVVAILASSGVTSLITARAVNRKTIGDARKAEEDADLADASARKTISEASALLLDPLMRRAQALENQLTAAQAEVQELRGQVHQMSKELGELREENARLLRDTPPTA